MMTRARHIAILILLLAACAAPCRAAKPQCGKLFGAPWRDVPQVVRQTADGGYIVAGYTDSFSVDQGDVWLIKLDADGNAQWQRTLGGADWDSAADILQTADGGYLLAGITESYRISYSGLLEAEDTGQYNQDDPGDLWLQKLDAEGLQEWSRTVGRPGHDAAATLEVAPDGSVAAAGVSSWRDTNETDAWFLTLSPGDDWARASAYGGKYINQAYAIVRAADGGYILAGAGATLDPDDPADMWAQKISPMGTPEWQHVYGGNKEDRISDIQAAPGGYIISGWTRSIGAGAEDYFLVMVDEHGEKIWSNAYGGIKNERARTARPTPDGGFIVAGSSFTFSRGDADIWILKINSQGATVWGKNFGGLEEDRAADVITTADGGFLVAGATNSFGAGWYDFWLIKLDAQGNCQWKPE